MEWKNCICEFDKILLCDAQTSGGLLIALPEKEAKKLENELRQNGVLEAVIVGTLAKSNRKELFIR